MASGKEGDRTPREAGPGPGKRRRAGRAAVEGNAGRGRGAAVVDVDLWGAFLGELWGRRAEGEGADDERPGDEGKAGEGPRTTATRPGR